ncbi:MAG: hypothetical protein PHG91_02055 [Syntrophales bacterium]|nr:hypothetical protein [Syntrophales bacterium]MDD5232155.1 hypothetical protein [Syntrophales bacterium]MDD5533347.1 hypothetical protein [Syntrophales bacterium]
MRTIAVFAAVLSALSCFGTAVAGGMFGPPQPVSRDAGGLHTAVGYIHYADIFKDGADHVIRQNHIYSQAGYGAHDRWEIYGRVSMSDLRISDAFRSANDAAVPSRSDFEDRWKFFGTLGGKGYYPFGSCLGMGIFVQASYAFGDFKDGVSGTLNGAPFATELKLKDIWDINFGIGLQWTVPRGVRLYAGPFAYYAEAKASPSPAVRGLALASEDVLIRNKTSAGGFAGVDIPIGKGFRLNLETRYSERFSLGSAIVFVY